MTATVSSLGAPSSGKAISGRALTNLFLGIAVFLGGFVLFEPAPYELLLAGLLAIGLLFGLKIPRGILPVIILISLYSLGGIISSFQMADYSRGLIYTATTFFLGLTTVFFAVLIAQDAARLRLIFRCYVAAAFVTSLFGIMGYFGFPGMEIFTRYGRAQGVFADPNVFSPFLVAPALYLTYGVMNRSVSMMPFRVAVLGVILLGLLLGFSRAGWGLMVITAAMFYFLLLVCQPDPRIRLKFILFGLFGLAIIVIGLAIALQFDAIYSIFSQRAQIVQDYDGARLGLFARHLIGFELALTNPLGIGPLEFGLIYGEDTHNVYLKGLMAYGWLGFVTWMILIFWTLIAGIKLLFRPTPWQPYFQIAYTVFFGHLLVGWVIDVEHWRHFYLMLGVVWGCLLMDTWSGAKPVYPAQRPTLSFRAG